MQYLLLHSLFVWVCFKAGGADMCVFFVLIRGGMWEGGGALRSLENDEKCPSKVSMWFSRTMLRSTLVFSG